MIVKKKRQFNEFMKILSKLEVVELIGVARILGVKLVEKKEVEVEEGYKADAKADKQGVRSIKNGEQAADVKTSTGPAALYQARDGIDIMTDIVNAFNNLNRKQRKNLLLILKEAEKDGTITEHSAPAS